MHLSNYNLRQLDAERLRVLKGELLRVVAEKRLLDLKAAREHFNQTLAAHRANYVERSSNGTLININQTLKYLDFISAR